MRLIEELDVLHAAYVDSINTAVANDDYNGADELARDYDDEAVQLIAERENKTHLLPIRRPTAVRETSLRRLVHRLRGDRVA